MIIRLLFILLCAKCIFSLFSCQDNKIKPLNPNGDTELAILMRDMYDEAEKIKNDIAAGKEVKFNLKHHEILTAESTMPEKAASPEYKSYAEIYLNAIEQMKNKPEDPEAAFQNMVASCTACHQSLCPGPLVKIKKLR